MLHGSAHLRHAPISHGKFEKFFYFIIYKY